MNSKLLNKGDRVYYPEGDMLGTVKEVYNKPIICGKQHVLTQELRVSLTYDIEWDCTGLVCEYRTEQIVKLGIFAIPDLNKSLINLLTLELDNGKESTRQKKPRRAKANKNKSKNKR